MGKLLTAFSTFLIVCLNVYSQETFPVNGVADKRNITYAFTHATIYIDYKTVLNDATLLITKDRIIDAGSAIVVPPDAVVIDCRGKYIYPSLIDIYTDYGIPAKTAVQKNRGPQFLSLTPGAYNWNQAIHPEVEAYRIFANDAAKAEEWRKLGFGAVMSHQKDGMARGTATLIALSDENENDILITQQAAACYSFDKGTSTQDYPGSLMGSIALLRQSFYDAQWYKNNADHEINISLQAINDQASLPQIFETSDVLNSLRAVAIAKEFGKTFIIKGGGDEYKDLQSVKASGASYIIPLKFPETIDVTDPYDAMNVSLEQLKHWELAPSNAGALEKAGVTYAFTTDGLKDKKDLYKNIRRAIELGLSKEQALRAFTEGPAQMLKSEKKIGALRKGMMANFIITSKEVFDKENLVLENWVKGKRFVIRRNNLPDIRGNYTLSTGNQKFRLRIAGDIYTPEVTVFQDSARRKVNISSTGPLFVFSFESMKQGVKGVYRLNGMMDTTGTMLLKGNGIDPDGNPIAWQAAFDSIYIKPPAVDSSEKSMPGEVWFPNMAYGSVALPKATTVIIKNATVWTNEKEGIVTGADVLIRDGKIISAGKNLAVPEGAEVIDGTGKHLTPGIIDEHSHIAVSGSVNEGTQASSAEVRIGDVVDCNDVHIYRQLAGGVTCSHLLHGSANPVGGQTQLIKLRWGKSAEEMKFKGWDGFIKFALGENVKQSHWGDDQVTRYPQTRMGVEQVYIDIFSRARNYDQQWKRFYASKDKNKIQPRRDLDLDAIAEILNAKRFITCHSYVQSEINMLMHVADSFNFKVNTFTHILEGYKVADKMKIHGAAASTFSDWWAYKYEVMEATPYNASILNRLGIITCMNSDDAEMARRLNQEAAKAVKYGNVSEEDALKMVTLNPAVMLHISDRVGSIKPGKDADLVLWNDHPLSVYARPLKTYVDGVCYFDAVRDEQLRIQNEKERIRIIQKMIMEKNKGGEIARQASKPKREKHCDDMENDWNKSITE
jgi:imidazolonepropionase-like amidohydrolase